MRRLFSASAAQKHRFRSDVPFGKVPEKIKEHYGITVPSGSVRIITENHAAGMKAGETHFSGIPEADGEEYIIAGTDGSLIPPADTEGEDGGRIGDTGGKKHV